jgi:prevent-host-death family protein
MGLSQHKSVPTLVNVHYAKTHFSKLVQRVQLGEEIVIARAGEPLAQLKALSEEEQNIHEAKTQLSQLLKQVEAGQEIIIVKFGRPVAKLSPLMPQSAKERQFGAARGLIWMSPDFDEEDETLLKMFGA